MAGECSAAFVSLEPAPARRMYPQRIWTSFPDLPPDVQPLPSADLVKRVCDADERISGFADGEAKGHEELLIELRQRGQRPAAVTDDEEDVAA